MRHRVRSRTLGRRTAHREAMMRNMVTSLLEHGRIVTTVTRAKELTRLADKMVTLAKEGGLHSRRQALAVVRRSDVVGRLFDELAPKFADRNGGYTRLVKMGPRRGDAVEVSVVELVTESLSGPKSSRRGRRQIQSGALIPQAPVAAEAPAPSEEAEAVGEEAEVSMAADAPVEEEPQSSDETEGATEGVKDESSSS